MKNLIFSAFISMFILSCSGFLPALADQEIDEEIGDDKTDKDYYQQEMNKKNKQTNITPREEDDMAEEIRTNVWNDNDDLAVMDSEDDGEGPAPAHMIK
ncbi:MAG TPA: hypothetical protein PKY78_07275 [Candidatus Omnitrophota bacterium]|nr:hypothetical protein [Candidatus Omnitrophota bacterium]HPS20768.1 hypothetical protein [Candidatus Omnitrophota bacterium]